MQIARVLSGPYRELSVNSAIWQEVPQTDPRAGYFAHRARIDAAIQSVLAGGRYILGDEVAAFQKEFAQYIGVRHAIGVASGTDAIEISLRACGIGRGDTVFTVAHTAVATVAAIEATGATPVLVDVDKATFTMDPESLESALSATEDGTAKAIIAVHLYGHPADLLAIESIARRHNLILIEDCAQSHGALLNGQRTGAIGRIAAFSFYPTKNLSTFGDGGMIVTDDDSLAERVRLLQQYGWRERYISEICGSNSRLDEIHAAILRVKLPLLDEDNQRRRFLAQLYNERLADTPLTLPANHKNATHVYHQYVVKSSSRDALRAHLGAAGIGTLIHYPVPVHRQPAYRRVRHAPGGLRNTDELTSQILSLPMFPQMSDDQSSQVANSIREFFSQL